MTSKYMKIRMPDGTWLTVGTSSRPLNMRMPDDTWKVFADGGGNKLKVRTDSTWTQVTSSGSSSGIITGKVFEYDSTFTIFTPLKNKTVDLFNTTTHHNTRVTTDVNGQFIARNLALGHITVTAYKSQWTPITTMNVILTTEDPIEHVELGFPQSYHVFEYSPNDAGRSDRFLWHTGMYAELREYFEWRGSTGQLGSEEITNDTSGLAASGYTTTGWTGAVSGDFGIDYRYRQDIVDWYSVPMGMFLEDSRIQFEATKLNDPTGWATADAVLEKIEVVHKLQGFSVEKYQVPWMNAYNWALTTLGYYPGVGALRYQGPTPDTFTITDSWKSSVYTVPAVRDHPYAHEEGPILWTGNLNDLGQTSGIHGIPYKEPIEVVQTFLPAAIPTVETGFQYHIQVGPLPEPISFAEADTRVNDAYTIQNDISDQIIVRVYYRWY